MAIIMLKNIPDILSPELLKTIMEMGHGDELVIADGNFPSGAHAPRVIRLDGHNIPYILDAVLKFFPLDSYLDNPTILMQVSNGDNYKPIIWEEYRKIGFIHEEKGLRELSIDRFEFYKRAKKAYATITTSETALYANIIIKKGVVLK